MKRGIRTSEFWMTIGQHVLGIIMLILGLFQGNPIVQVITMVIGGLMNVLGTGGYQMSRAKVKQPYEPGPSRAVSLKTRPSK